MSAFDELRSTKTRKSRGCPVCGGKNTGRVALVLQEINPSGKTGVAVVGRSRSMCEKHAAETYKAVLALLDGVGP